MEVLIHRHRWTVVERIGAITVQRCTRCPKTRVRLQPTTTERTPDA